jgi:hypothetical protein
MHRVQKVRALPDYRLFVEFSDGVRGTVDLSSRLFGSVFKPLEDPELFSQVSIDRFGAICWPNGADLAPDALHERLRGSQADDGR